VREPPRGRLDAVVAEDKPSLWESTQFLWRQRAAFHIVMGGGLCALWGWGLIYWTPTFLQRAYNLDVGQAGAVTGNIHLVGGSAATVFTAWLLSRPFMTDPRRVMWLMMAGVGFATIPSIIAYATHSLRIAELMFCCFIPAIYFYIGPSACSTISPPAGCAMSSSRSRCSWPTSSISWSRPKESVC
jgi:hypothetical protein